MYISGLTAKIHRPN